MLNATQVKINRRWCHNDGDVLDMRSSDLLRWAEPENVCWSSADPVNRPRETRINRPRETRISDDASSVARWPHHRRIFRGEHVCFSQQPEDVLLTERCGETGLSEAGRWRGLIKDVRMEAGFRTRWDGTAPLATDMGDLIRIGSSCSDEPRGWGDRSVLVSALP